MLPWRENISVYVHLPWCTSKCPYCDFNSFLRTPSVREDLYINCLLQDLEEDIKLAPGRVVSSIYLGGGTPSLFSSELIARLLAGISEKVSVRESAEVTLEINPESASFRKLEVYKRSGVNRISIGVQSFSNDVLTALSRPHNAIEARNAILLVEEVGFENINIDLMFGAPSGTYNSDMLDLNEAISFQPGHISRYQLTIEEGTKFHVSPPKVPDEDAIYRSYSDGLELLKDSGFNRYEVSAYSLPGRASSHNLHYWRYGDYIGIGAGAHGKITIGKDIYRTKKTDSPTLYMKKLKEKRADSEKRLVSEEDALIEYAINITRLTDGFEVSDLYDKTGIKPGAQDVDEKINRAEKAGFFEREGELIKPTKKGQLFLNDLQLIFLN